MTATNQADRSLILAASRLTTGRRAQRLTIRWAHDPHLNGWVPSAVLDALTDRDHDSHDGLLRGLTACSQSGDEDATVLILSALRPGLWKLAHTYHRARLSEAFDDLLVNAVHVIARVDPSDDRLYDRILGRIRAATPRQGAERGEEPVAEFDDWPTGSESDVVDQLEARDLLHRLSELRTDGGLDPTAWDDLVAVRIHGIPARDIARGRSTRHVRADISRFGNRLERLLAA